MTGRVRRTIATLAAAGVLVVAFAGSSTAQTAALETTIREVSFDSTGQTRVVVSVAGAAVSGGIDSSAFTVFENGQRIENIVVEQLFETQTRPVVVELLFDVSGSTRDLLGSAKAAAQSFIGQLPDPVRVGLISFGSEMEVLLEPVALASARDEVTSSIAALQTDPETARGTKLYDAVVRGADSLKRQFNAQRNMVIFSDGGDTDSSASLEAAINSVKEVDAPVTNILLPAGSVAEEPLQALAQAEDAGRFLRIDDTAQLNEAFARVAQSISSQYVLTYAGSDRETAELDIQVAVAVDGANGADSSVVVNKRNEAGPAGPQIVDEKPLVGLLANPLGLILGVGAAFVGLLLFLMVILQAPAGKMEERTLQRRLRMYSRSERQKQRVQQENEGGGFLSASPLGRKAVALMDKVPRSKQFDEKVQQELDRAAWPVRASEFLLITIGAIILGFLVGFLLFQQLYWGVLLAVAGGFIPRLVLAQRVSKRTSDFLGQLPDTLQLLAGSLQAGYGFMQALDTVAKEAQPPTSNEFARVLAEARLGMPVEQALDDMADRVGGEDFRWVVMAINIQRQVGGNLAALLQTVANTLRERERVRRQIKVLSAEGRLSAYVLIALPFALFGYLQLVNPEYIGELTKATFGKVLIVVSLVLISVGAFWMRKIIKIDV